MDNFKFNFLSRGQLESLNLDRLFLPLFKILPCMLRGIFGNLIFAIIVRIGCSKIILIYIFWIMGLKKSLLSTTERNDYRSLNSSSVKRRDYSFVSDVLLNPRVYASNFSRVSRCADGEFELQHHKVVTCSVEV